MNNFTKRRLGNSVLEVGPLAFGGNVFGWTVDEPRSFKILDAFVASGLTMVDTADVYSRWAPGNKGGESETVIGHWLEARGGRDKVVIATKVGNEMGPDAKGLSKAYILRAVEGSLQRLKTDYIDLYQAHRDDPETSVSETLEAFAGLVKVGKVRAIGASNYEAPRLAEALKVSKEHGLPRYESLQPNYSLYERAKFEGELAALCERENLTVIPYFPLASGFLTGKYRSEKDLEGRPRAMIVKSMLNERGFRILAALDTVSKELSATPAQVSLAWLMARKTVPIASATTVEQLEELIKSTELKLSAEAMRVLNQASEPMADGSAGKASA